MTLTGMTPDLEWRIRAAAAEATLVDRVTVQPLDLDIVPPRSR